MHFQTKPARVWEAPDPASDLPCSWVSSMCLWGRGRLGALARWQVSTREATKGRCPHFPAGRSFLFTFPDFHPPSMHGCRVCSARNPSAFRFGSISKAERLCKPPSLYPRAPGAEARAVPSSTAFCLQLQGSAALVLER